MHTIDKKNGERFIVLTVSFRQDGDKWLARCIELGTSTFGNTFEGAQEALKEAIDLAKHGFDSLAGGAYVSPDGKYLFFHLKEDIWWVDIKIIENLKPVE